MTSTDGRAGGIRKEVNFQRVSTTLVCRKGELQKLLFSQSGD